LSDISDDIDDNFIYTLSLNECQQCSNDDAGSSVCSSRSANPLFCLQTRVTWQKLLGAKFL